MAFSPSGRYNDRQAQIIAINSVLVFLSVLAVGLRFWARKIQKCSFYLDDWLILVALGGALAVNGLLYYSIHVGVGEHVVNLTPQMIEAYSLNLYIMQLFWNTTLPIIKLSILLFLKRVFTRPSMKYACYGLMVFLGMWYIAFQVTAIFQCTPIDHDWLRETTEGHCVDFVPFVITLATTNLATDVALLVLPVHEIAKLQMRTTQKVGLSFTFGIGFIICAVAIVRINSVDHINLADITWSDTYAHLWTAIESSLGVVVACIPHLMPVYRKICGEVSQLASYGRNSAKRNSTAWNSAPNTTMGRPQSHIYSTAQSHQYSSSEPDKEGKESEDDLDLIPKNGIEVRTHMEHRVESAEHVHHQGKVEAIPMHAL